VHPFNSEAVNYTTARSSLMSGFFYLLGFYCWVIFREGKPLTSIFYLTSLLAFMACMLSKEVVITLPFVLWLYDLYFGERRRTLLNWRTYIHYLPFVFIVVIPYIVLWVSSFGGVLPPFNRSIWTQIFTALPVLILHWKMFLMPLHLTPVHYVEVYKTFWSFSVIHSTLMLIIYVAIAILLYRILSRPCRLVSFFMLWFLIVLSPTTIVPLNAIFQENRGYLAVVSFVIPAGVIMGELWNTRIKKLVLAGLVLITIFYSAEVVQRNMVWRDDITLWSDAAKKAPEIPITYSSLGSAYRKAGMYDQAIGAYKKAQAVGGPAYYAARYNLAQVYIAQERWNLAALELEKVKEALLDNSQSRDRDDLVTVYNDLEMVYGKSGQSELAEKISKEAQWRLEKVP
ncbi:MAG TPA: tetratricopeptide repeat protein, partial [Geobacteraceae bacterium]|nr:tetratricopeptide repeat protein [Geobacteraceae bacterium]